VKRQRSGGKDRQQQQPPPLQQQRPGQQPQAGFQQQQQQQQRQPQQPQQQPQRQQQQQHQDPQQQGGYQQGLAHQPQQQVQRDPSISAVAAAAAAELCQLMVGAPGRRSPMRQGSPLRDSFGNTMVSMCGQELGIVIWRRHFSYADAVQRRVFCCWKSCS
jgi:hypothetical protein